jgi:hypothetical protein
MSVPSSVPIDQRSVGGVCVCDHEPATVAMIGRVLDSVHPGDHRPGWVGRAVGGDEPGICGDLASRRDENVEAVGGGVDRQEHPVVRLVEDDHV